MYEFLALVVAVIIGVLVVVILYFRALVRGARDREAKPAKPAQPDVPAARVVRDRDKS